jgi:hypothetical protein
MKRLVRRLGARLARDTCARLIENGGEAQGMRAYGPWGKCLAENMLERRPERPGFSLRRSIAAKIRGGPLHYEF